MTLGEVAAKLGQTQAQHGGTCVADYITIEGRLLLLCLSTSNYVIKLPKHNDIHVYDIKDGIIFLQPHPELAPLTASFRIGIVVES